jgi:hypothetical protein
VFLKLECLFYLNIYILFYLILYSKSLFDSNKSKKRSNRKKNLPNANQIRSSNYGNAFKHQDYPAGSAKAQAILAGSKNFQTIEIEVFTKKKLILNIYNLFFY